MNKTELIAEISEKTEVSRKQVEDILNAFTDVVEECLRNDEKVVVTGFGTFEVRTRVTRNGRNPRTGEMISIPEQKTPAFKAGKILKDAVK